jgi:hypothetical protein
MKTKSNNRKSAAGGIKAEGTVGFERENRYIRNHVNRRYPLYEPGRCLVGFMRKTDEEIAEKERLREAKERILERTRRHRKSADFILGKAWSRK